MDSRETDSILMVWVDDVCDHPITLEVLHQVFSVHGYVEKIVMFPDSDEYFDALIQFHSHETAVSAIKFLRGRSLHDGCCQLDIELSSDFKDLQVFANNEWSRDFRKARLPSEQNGTSYQNYGFIDSREPTGCNVVKDCYVFDADLITEIGRTMKKHTDNLMKMLEGVTMRLLQLEDSVDDVKASLRQVHSDVQVVNSKQEKLEAQLQHSKVKRSKVGQQLETQISGQAASSAPLHSHRQLLPFPHTQQSLLLIGSEVGGGSNSSSSSNPSKSQNIWSRMMTWLIS